MSDMFDQIHAERQGIMRGTVVGYDHKDGLPIVDRSTADTEKPKASTAKPAEKPEAPAEKPESTQPKPKEEGSSEQPAAAAKPAALAKGSAVSMPDGSTGKISYLDSQMKIARVTKDKGGSATHPLSKLKAADSPEAKETDVPAGHTFVKAHLRPLPEKAK